MKKLLILLVFVVVAITASAQSRTASINLDNGQTYYLYSANAKDTCGLATTTWYHPIVTKLEFHPFYDVKLNLHRMQGTAARVACVWQARKFPDDTWTALTTTVYGGTQADTSINYTQVTTATFYREFRLAMTVSGSARQQTRVDSLMIKFYK
jgi:hypothetical protein